VGTEDYPLSRRLYLYLPAKAPKAAADFVEFALSDAGQDVVKQIGFVSQNIYAEQIPDSADWPESYRSLVAGAQRLSVNFRFDSGGENLDSKAQRDLQRLVSFIGKNPGRAIMLAGFTDNVGKPEVNMALSHQRADAIAAALRARGIDVLDVRGLGSANPVSSNDSDAGRVRNRRVEVWIK
jgi:phosphate transport system substrate-binding protein